MPQRMRGDGLADPGLLSRPGHRGSHASLAPGRGTARGLVALAANRREEYQGDAATARHICLPPLPISTRINIRLLSIELTFRRATSLTLGPAA